MPKVKAPRITETPEAIRIEAGYATKAEVIRTDLITGPPLDKVENGEPGVNGKTIERLADLYGVPFGRMYAAYAHARALYEARKGAA